MKAKLALLVLAVIVGIWIGQASDTVETKYRVIHDTETVTKTKTVEVPGDVPSECADLVRHTRTIMAATKQFDKTNSGVLDIMSRTRKAVALGDSNSINDLETELRKLDGKTIEAIETLGETKEPFEEAVAACSDAQ